MQENIANIFKDSCYFELHRSCKFESQESKIIGEIFLLVKIYYISLENRTLSTLLPSFASVFSSWYLKNLSRHKINKADNPAIGAEHWILKLFEFYFLNFEKFR